MSCLFIQTSGTNAFNARFLVLYCSLVCKVKTSHAALYAQHVVVDREHVERWRRQRSVREVLASNRNLRVVDSGEVAGTRWLVLFWLKREGVRVDTWVWGTGVVVEWLDLVEVLTRLLFESVLTVQDQLKRRQWTNRASRINRTIFLPCRSGTLSRIDKEQWRTNISWRNSNVRGQWSFRNQNNVISGGVRAEVPHVSARIVTGVNTPDQFLDWVVVRQSDLLGAIRSDRVSTSVLDLFDQVFVTLLRESSALFSVEVDVVTPDLEGVRVQVRFKIRGQVKVQSDFVVLQSNQWQSQSWVSVKEEDQWQKDLVASNTGARSHLTVVLLRGGIQVQLRVQSPPSLVVFVDSLTTDGQFNVLDGTFRGPDTIGSTVSSSRSNRERRQFNVHIRNQITVSGDRDRNSTRVTGSTVNSLFDVFHREVSVAFVNRLEESDFWVTSQVDVLGAIGDELHETSGHCVCVCTIDRDFFFGRDPRKNSL